VLWKGCFAMRKNKKTNNNFFQLLKKLHFLKFEQATNKKQLYNAPLLKAAHPAYRLPTPITPRSYIREG
jgi:hypothetical protein